MTEPHPIADTHPAPPTELLASASDYLAERLGLHFPPERWPELLQALTAARQDASNAQDDAPPSTLAPFGEDRLAALATRLTIGETYFFREVAAFAALRDTILPELIRDRRDGGRRLRLWSAGCASGEEAYSLAIELVRAIPDIEQWNVSVLATDINPLFLIKASRGVYDEWSFRQAAPELKAECFSRDDQGHQVIAPRFKALVSFSRLNLMDDTYPASSTRTMAMDVIFCRNVLMYFRPDRARAVLDKLCRCLVDGGWLVLSPVEASLVTQPELVAQRLADTIVFRKMANAPPRERERVGDAIPPIVTDTAPTLAPARIEPGAATTAAAASHSPTNAPAMALLARGAADQGKLDEALDWCRQALSADALNPSWNYLRATILLEKGDPETAAAALQRTLYLDPGHVMAHVAMAGLAARQGRQARMRKHYDDALALLTDRPPEQLLPDGDGISAGQLRQIIAARTARSEPK